MCEQIFSLHSKLYQIAPLITIHQLAPPIWRKKKTKIEDKNTCHRWHWTHDAWHVTCDKWHVTHDMLHVTCDIWWEVNIVQKGQVPSSYGLGVEVFWRYFKKRVTQLINLWIIDEGVLEQIRLHRLCLIC